MTIDDLAGELAEEKEELARNKENAALKKREAALDSQSCDRTVKILGLCRKTEIVPSHGREDTEAAADPSRSRHERHHFRSPVFRPTVAIRLTWQSSRLRPVVSAPKLQRLP